MNNKYFKLDKDDSNIDNNVSELNSKPLESIFSKSLKKKKWYKTALIQLFFIYLIPINFKNRYNQQLEIFIRYFNRSYNSNYHIEYLDFDFYKFYLKYVKLKAIYFLIGFYSLILLVLIILIPTLILV